jgi:hypothetical protein
LVKDFDCLRADTVKRTNLIEPVLSQILERRDADCSKSAASGRADPRQLISFIGVHGSRLDTNMEPLFVFG